MWRVMVESLLPAAAILILYFVLPLRGQGAVAVSIIFAVVAVLFSFPLAFRAAKRVMESHQPIVHGGQAVLMILTSVVVAFSGLYYVLGTHYENQMMGVETRLDALYFTLTLTTTVGFGDVHPVGQAARGVATWNMVCNIAIIAIAVRLVMSAIQDRRVNG